MNPTRNTTNNNSAKYTNVPNGTVSILITQRGCPKTNGTKDQAKVDLLEAVSANDEVRCRNLLKDGEIDLKEKNSFFFHPFLRAAQNGFLEILKLLFENGADINVQDNNKSTALHLAIKQHHKDCAIFLLEREIKYKELKDKDGNLAIHLAALEGMKEVVAWMLDQGHDPNVKNKKNQAPFHFAVMKGHSELIKPLLLSQAKCDVKDISLKYPLHYAAENGHDKCCDQLLVEKPDHSIAIDKEGNTPLILAAKKGHSRCCKSLCSAMADIQCLVADGIDKKDHKGNTALHHAAKCGFNKTIMILHDFNANFCIKNNDGDTPIHMAATQKHLDCLKDILNYVVDKCPGVNKSKQGLLHIAANNGCAQSLEYLLEKDAFLLNINLKDINGRTALHFASSHSDPECVAILMKNKASCTIVDDELNTPLHLAASKGLTDLCKLLLQESGITMINKKNLKGETPLHLAALNGSLHCCTVLLNKGALIGEKNCKGYSPYHVAAEKGQLVILKLFTKKKGSLINEAVEGSGDTPLHIATRNGHYQCCQFLLDHLKKNKNFILKLNENNDSVLDVAYNTKNDDIFGLILSRCPVPNLQRDDNEFESMLHSFMHKALVNERERPIIQRAIIESKWWFSGFSNCFCEKGLCQNFHNIIKSNPESARLVFDHCVKNIDGVKIYDFRILEQEFYVPLNQDDSTDSYIIYAPAFNLETGKLKQECLNFDCPHGCYREFALKKAIENDCRDVVQHPLVEGYWEYKWGTYLKSIMYGLLAIEIVIVTVLSLYMSNTWNWTQVNETLQKLNEELESENQSQILYNISGNCSEDLLNALKMTELKLAFLIGLRACLALMAVCMILSEWHMWKKFDWKSYFTVGVVLRILRLILIVVLIIPMTTCINHIWITMTWQWLFGLTALLMSWFNMIHMLNYIPSLSVFMPITYKFVKSFLLVLLYILLIIFIFSFIFHLLFHNHAGFSNLGISIIKSIVWIMGDLAYDDMFLDDGKPITYFVFSNIVFILFVTSIGGFIANLIISQPTEHFESFKSDAAWYQDFTRIQVLLKFDTIFHDWRKRNTVGFWVRNARPIHDIKSLILKKLYQEDKVSLPKKKLTANLSNSEKEEVMDNKQFEILMTKIEELKRHILENK